MRRRFRRGKRRGGRRRFVRRRRTNRPPAPGKPIPVTRIASNPWPVRGARDCAHRRTVGAERLVDFTSLAPDGVWDVTYGTLLDQMAPRARTENTVVCLRWIYAWSGTPGNIYGYLYQPECMNLTNISGNPADGTIALSDIGSYNSMPKVGFKIPWTSRFPRLMDTAGLAATVARFTHYGAQQIDAAKTKHYIYVRAGITFWQ